MRLKIKSLILIKFSESVPIQVGLRTSLPAWSDTLSVRIVCMSHAILTLLWPLVGNVTCSNLGQPGIHTYAHLHFRLSDHGKEQTAGFPNLLVEKFKQWVWIHVWFDGSHCKFNEISSTLIKLPPTHAWTWLNVKINPLVIASNYLKLWMVGNYWDNLRRSLSTTLGNIQIRHQVRDPSNVPCPPVCCWVSMCEACLLCNEQLSHGSQCRGQRSPSVTLHLNRFFPWNFKWKGTCLRKSHWCSGTLGKCFGTLKSLCVYHLFISICFSWHSKIARKYFSFSKNGSDPINSGHWHSQNLHWFIKMEFWTWLAWDIPYIW